MVDLYNWLMSIGQLGRMIIAVPLILAVGVCVYLYWLWQDTRRGR